MFSFIIRRLLYLPVVIFGVTVLIVLLMQLLSPAQRAASYVRSEAQLRNLDAIIRQYNLDAPFHIQYVNWLRQAASGNLGYSRASREPVMQTIRRRFPATLELAILAFFPIVGVGVWLGSAAAFNRDRFVDQFTRILAIFGWSIPTFVMGIWLLVIFYGALGSFFQGFLGGFFNFAPGRISDVYRIEIATSDFRQVTNMMTVDALLNGRLDIFWDALRHLILPVVTLATVSSAQIMRVMRSSLLDTLSQDYVRTARAKGLAERSVRLKHARRNALIPVITLAGFTFIGLLNGVVITETIFNYPGVGQWGAAAAVALDYPGILGFTLLTALIVVIGNLLVDILYSVVDPRIRYD